MGNIRKIKEDYYIEFYARGLLYQQKVGRDAVAAERVLKEVEEKIVRGELMTIVREIHVESFFSDYLAQAVSQCSPATFRRIQSTAQHFQEFLKVYRVEITNIFQITPAVVEQYRSFLLKNLAKSGVDFNGKIVTLTILLLREILEYGIKTGFINDNPTIHIRLLKASKSHSRLNLSAEDVTTILRNSELSLNLVINFLLQTGLRISELVTLKWEHVNWEKALLTVMSGHATREIPLNLNAVHLLKERAEGNVFDSSWIFTADENNPWTLELLYEKLDACLRQISLKVPVRFSNFRVVFACQLLRQGVTLMTVGKILGLSDIGKMMYFAECIPLSRDDIYEHY